MTTLERLIDTLRGIDGPVTLDEVQVRELVAWFETARRSLVEFEVDAWHNDIADMGLAELRIRLAESRRAVKNLNGQVDAHLVRIRQLEAESFTPEQSEEFLRRLDGEEIRKAVEAEREACARAADSYGAHDVARVIRGWGGK